MRVFPTACCLALSALLGFVTGCGLTTSDRDLDPIERAQAIETHLKTGRAMRQELVAQNLDLSVPGHADQTIETMERVRREFQRAVDLDLSSGKEPSSIPRRELGRTLHVLALTQRYKLDQLEAEADQSIKSGRPVPPDLQKRVEAARAQAVDYAKEAYSTLDFYRRTLHPAYPWSSVHLGIADCLEILGQWEQAANALEQFLMEERGASAQLREGLRRRIRAMREQAYNEIDAGL